MTDQVWHETRSYEVISVNVKNDALITGERLMYGVRNKRTKHLEWIDHALPVVINQTGELQKALDDVLPPSGVRQ